ncbi:MAG: DNA methyltransferase [Candidatus Bathyarchaeia archaeon]
MCRKCSAPRREVCGPALSAPAFNIRVRDAQKGILSSKWGKRFSTSATEIRGYREQFYQTRREQRLVAKGCSCHAGFAPGIVLDPFAGSGTTMKVAKDLGRSSIGIEINPEYSALARRRIGDEIVILPDSDEAVSADRTRGRPHRQRLSKSSHSRLL